MTPKNQTPHQNFISLRCDVKITLYFLVEFGIFSHNQRQIQPKAICSSLNPLCGQLLELGRDLAQDDLFEIDLVTCIVDVNPGEVTLRIIVEDYTF